MNLSFLFLQNRFSLPEDELNNTLVNMQLVYSKYHDLIRYITGKKPWNKVQ